MWQPARSGPVSAVLAGRFAQTGATWRGSSVLAGAQLVLNHSEREGWLLDDSSAIVQTPCFTYHSGLLSPRVTRGAHQRLSSWKRSLMWSDSGDSLD
ncbi:hypothetical protein DPEC_G00270210 [Dallia pectoralis]|uniref:Uncharacterized protein n=1 Tax=Dallia pectoralis TaxID=75939 RepID=A0ACC2FPI5_DALPE|nr:hypothetical protein DPEC_G00270210 [Dallia pectoralis]